MIGGESRRDGDREKAINAFIEQRSAQSIYAQMYGQRTPSAELTKARL